MCHYGFNVGIDIIVFSEKVIFVIGISVKAVVRTELTHKIYFALTFRKVRLNGDAVCHLDFAKLFHKLIGTARYEAGC